ncbi:hypothetical protein DL765_005238 [Monosporascus sp. GIB2]|nr:hypothetical protein DL765_005238 [Monosporascus sp. GIB2]
MDVQDPFNGDEDAALRYAIELSLQDVENKGTEVLSDDSSSDEDLEKRPIYPSVTKKAGNSSMQGTSKDATLATPQTAPTMTCGLSGLDRKKMEEERLARLGKRKAREEDQMIQEPRQRATTDGTPTLAASAAIGYSASLPFPTGVIKKTWTAGYRRTGDDIKIEEVLQKDELEMAVLSSFQWDEDWLLSKIDIGKTKMLLIAFASSATRQEEMKANVPEERIKFCFPPIPYDWGETGVMENVVFLIDLPRRDTTVLNRNKPTLFEEELCYFLRAQGLDEALVKSLARYDFSATARYGFVHCIGQSHMGYCGLGRTITALGLSTTGDVEIDYVVSSLGSVNMDLISAIYHAAQGDNGLKEYEERSARNAKGKRATKAQPETFEDRFRVYFPSHDTVNRSRGGKNAAGTICLQSKWWDSATFPRRLVRDCKSVRAGLLMHSKMLLVRHSSGSPTAWGYVGSANLSDSAWGRLVKDKATGKPKLTCRNWECGVLVPVRDHGRIIAEGRSSPGPLSIFQDTIPIPMEVPGEAYSMSGTKRPWLFLER